MVSPLDLLPLNLHRPVMVSPPRAKDPLNVLHDGISLRSLLEIDENNRRESYPRLMPMTPAQRLAVSAYWSQTLRVKVAASEQERDRVERERVTVDLDVD